MDYSEKADQVQYNERIGIVRWLSIILIIFSFISFYGAPFFLEPDVVGYLQHAMPYVGLPLAAYIFVMLRSLTKFKKIQNMHGLQIGDIIMWEGHECEIKSFKMFNLSVVSLFNGRRHTVAYTKLEDESVESVTPIDLRFGPDAIRGYIVSTHIDIMNPKGNLNDLVLKKHDGENPMPISKWTGLLQDVGNYAGYPERGKDGEFVGYASGFETSYHISPMDRNKFHAAVRIEFFFKMPFDSRKINPNRDSFEFWMTFKYMSDFNAAAIQYMNTHMKREVKKDG